MAKTEFPMDASIALIVVDVQQAFNYPPYAGKSSSTPACYENVGELLKAFREASLPLVHIRHHSTNPKSPFHPVTNPDGIKPLPEAAELPGEIVFTKNVNSSFIGTPLEKHLKDNGIKTLVIVGCTTTECVSTTVRMAANLGWEVFLPRDATATFEKEPAPGAREGLRKFDAETMHEVALAELQEEFATVVTTEEVLGAVKKYQP